MLITDITACADMLEKHDSTIKKLLQRARDYSIKLNFNKMQYYVQEVKYLGRIFSEEDNDVQVARHLNLIGLKLLKMYNTLKIKEFDIKIRY